MTSFGRPLTKHRLGDYAIPLLAVGIAVVAGVFTLRAGAAPLAAAPLGLAIAISAWYGGFGPGLFALALAAAGADLFLVQPGSVMRFASVAEAVAFAVFLAGWLVFCILAERVYRQLQRDRDLRAAAENSSSQANRLAQLTAALAQARTPRAAIEASLQEPLHALKADAGMLLLTSRDGQTAEIARAVAYPEGTQPETISLAEPGPISDAVGRGAPIVLPWSVVVPLLIGSRVVAVVKLDFSSQRELSADDHEYVRAFATYAARALDRTWQLEFAERARSDAEHLRAQAHQELAERKTIEHALRASETRYRALAARTSRLHTLSSALSEAVTVDAVARAVITHGRIVAGATAGEVMMLVEDGSHFDTLYGETTDPHGAELRHMPVEDGLCATEAVRTRRPVFVKSLTEWQDRYWRSASIAADGGYESSATMPLLVENAPIGVLAFHFTVPVNFDDDYQALLTSVAQHCAQALDRARLYESTQRARADAERANRIKDEFVSVVSHELRTPLSAILGWAGMLQRGTLNGEKTARALQSIADNASRQARLIEELLDFSRVASGRTSLHIERVDIRELVRNVVESMVPTAAARGIDLHLSPAPPVDVEGDVRRLEQVFFNLIDNALKFTPKGGRVSLDVRIVDGLVEVQVTDTGAGIDAEFLPRVFDRFRQADSTTSRAHGGLGLGLSIAKQLVEAHKGTIEADSAGKGHGASFTVRLPAAASRASEEFSVEARPPAPHSDLRAPVETRLDGLRVLVVDDEADAREVMAQTLETYGANVELAESAREALEILEHLRVDVLLADIAMPDEDGFALIRNVRASSVPGVSTIPAAAVTAFTREEHRQHALTAGFQMHLGKPFQPAELVRAVDLLAHRAIH
jgi:K+-sensing histidine kinase KdpD